MGQRGHQESVWEAERSVQSQASPGSSAADKTVGRTEDWPLDSAPGDSGPG